MAKNKSDPNAIFTPDKFTLKPHIALLDEHSKDESNSGKNLDVTEDLLNEIAEVNNARFARTQDAAPHVIGHTRGGIHEKDQGDILGYWANFHVAPFYNTGRKALFADLYVRNDRLEEAKEYPRRSIEYWRKSKVIDPVAALKANTPERDLGLLVFDRGGEEVPYRYSLPPETEMDDQKVATQEAAIAATESQPFRQLISKVEEFANQLLALKQQSDLLQQQTELQGQTLAAITQILDSASDEYEQSQPGDPSDLLGPADADPAAQGTPQTPQSADGSGGPEKFEAASAGPNSTYVPSTPDEEKVKMAREGDKVIETKTEGDEALKFSRLEKENEVLKKAVEQLQKANEETALKFARTNAEKLVAELETNDHIDFKDSDNREWHVNLFAGLDDKSRETMVGRVKLHYQRKTPNNSAEIDALKFSRTEVETKGFRSPEDVQKFVAANAKTGVSLEEYLAKTGK